MDGKGSRKHQQEISQLAGAVVGGAFEGKSITLDCTPGGGKTGSGTLLANQLLDAGTVNAVLWVVPRLSLAEQVRDAFASGFGSRPGRVLEVVDGQDELFPPSLPNTPQVVGCVTTYQSVAHGKNYERFRDAVSSRRTLIVFDEVQFLNDDVGAADGMRSGWYRKVKEVQAAAAFTLVMSGTLWRTDGRRIPFVDYEKRADGLWYPLAHVGYSYRDAVAERAVLPTEWRNRGGVVEYAYNGTPHEHDLLEDNDDEESRKVRAFLAGDNAVGGLLDDMADHWKEWRRKVYQSRMIVMADDTTQARKWRHYLQERHGVPCVLATSREEAAGRQLRHFRERKQGQCLVTVAMAYVGFDCPDLTHLAYLSTTRAPSWLLQSFARISRFDGGAPVDYDHQHAFVFAPDDLKMRAFMAWLREQQDMGLADRRGFAPRDNSAPAVVTMPDDFDPIGAVPGGVAVESLLGRIPPETEAKLREFGLRCPAADGVPHSKLYEILRSAGWSL